MGNQKQKWTAEEEEALLAGVAKHGPGKWKNILKDPEFAPFLTHRSNIDLKHRDDKEFRGRGWLVRRDSWQWPSITSSLKVLSDNAILVDPMQDKWRNLSVSTASQGSKEKSRAPKAKAVVAASLSNNQNSAPSRFNAPTDTAGEDPPNNSTQDGKNAPRYNAMIFEALSTIKDSNGCDIGAIVNFIEQRHEVPQNFRRLLSSRLRRLVTQGKLEKVQNYYKVKKDNSLAVKTPTPKQKDVRQRISQYTGGLMPSGETVEDAAKAAAYKVADAENKSFLAAEAVKEAERIAKMAEDTDSMLQMIKDIYEQCSRGEIILLA